MGNINITKFRIGLIIIMILALATSAYAGYVFPRMSVTWTSGGIDYRLLFNPKEYTITANGNGLNFVIVGSNTKIINFLIVVKTPGRSYLYHFNNGEMLQNDFVGSVPSEVSNVVNQLFDGIFSESATQALNIRKDISVILLSNPFPFTINSIPGGGGITTA